MADISTLIAEMVARARPQVASGSGHSQVIQGPGNGMGATGNARQTNVGVSIDPTAIQALFGAGPVAEQQREKQFFRTFDVYQRLAAAGNEEEMKKFKQAMSNPISQKIFQEMHEKGSPLVRAVEVEDTSQPLTQAGEQWVNQPYQRTETVAAPIPIEKESELRRTGGTDRNMRAGAITQALGPDVVEQEKQVTEPGYIRPLYSGAVAPKGGSTQGGDFAGPNIIPGPKKVIYELTSGVPPSVEQQKEAGLKTASIGDKERWSLGIDTASPSALLSGMADEKNTPLTRRGTKYLNALLSNTWASKSGEKLDDPLKDANAQYAADLQEANKPSDLPLTKNQRASRVLGLGAAVMKHMWRAKEINPKHTAVRSNGVLASWVLNAKGAFDDLDLSDEEEVKIGHRYVDQYADILNQGGVSSWGEDPYVTWLDMACKVYGGPAGALKAFQKKFGSGKGSVKIFDDLMSKTEYAYEYELQQAAAKGQAKAASKNKQSWRWYLNGIVDALTPGPLLKGAGW